MTIEKYVEAIEAAKRGMREAYPGDDLTKTFDTLDEILLELDGPVEWATRGDFTSEPDREPYDFETHSDREAAEAHLTDRQAWEDENYGPESDQQNLHCTYRLQKRRGAGEWEDAT